MQSFTPRPDGDLPANNAICLEALGPDEVVVTMLLGIAPCGVSGVLTERGDALDGSQLGCEILHALAGGWFVFARTAALEAQLRGWVAGAPGSQNVCAGPPAWPAPKAKRAVREKTVPPQVRQPTFLEARTLGSAVASGRTGRHWRAVEGDAAMRFQIPGDKLQVRFNGSDFLGWLGLPADHEGLRQSLREMGLPAVFTLFVGLGLALESRTGRATIAVDDLIRAIGADPRSTDEREDWRRRVWGWLLAFEAMPVIGARPGVYRDPATRRKIELRSVDPLIRVTGVREGVRVTAGSTEPPLEVSITLGEWCMQHHGNRKILSDFGELRRLAAIPGGKASGSFARSIGLALQQRWRERSHDASTRPCGDGVTVRFRHAFTRRDLLSVFPPDPPVESFADCDNPARARQYWDEAIDTLKDAGVVAHYRELDPLPDTRQGWFDAWLDQPLEILPAKRDGEAVAEIAESARAAAASRRSRKRKK